MDPLAPSDLDMMEASGDETMEDALYDDDEDALIVEEDFETTTATPAVTGEVEMAPVDDGSVPVEVDEVLEVEEEGGVDIEVLPQEVGGGGEDVAFEDAEDVTGGEESSSSKVDGGFVVGEEIVLEEEPSAEEQKKEEKEEGSAAPPPSIEPSTAIIESTPPSLLLPASTPAPLAPDAESFVIVEAPSDAETNGKLGEEEERRKQDEVNPVSNEEPSEEHIAESHIDEASETTRPELETPSNYFSTNTNSSIDADPSSSKPRGSHTSEPLHPSHYTNGHGDDEDDSFSSYSDASSSHFPSDFFLSTIITYPSNSSVPTPSPYSLFQPFADEAHEGVDLPVLLASNPDLFRAPLTELFDALREEGAFSVEDKALNMEDEGGTLEWVLEHENEGVALVIGEVRPSSPTLLFCPSA
ncbi:hypothetical protein BDY24DRAFT_239300 [Mrakia frigida]|uniref:uncharacterized protein n=1 Tax=Mrakia frigida TaxID=29902 RepID=UPI003FCC002B